MKQTLGFQELVQEELMDIDGGSLVYDIFYHLGSTTKIVVTEVKSTVVRLSDYRTYIRP